MGRVAERGRDASSQRPFLGQDQRIAGLAARQHGVFSLDQLVEIGLAASTVRHRAEAGRFHRVHRGVYSLMPLSLLTRGGRYMAAVLACGPGAVLSHRSAADLLGLRRTDRTRIDVTVPRRTGRDRRDIDLHRSTTLTPADTTSRRGIP